MGNPIGPNRRLVAAGKRHLGERRRGSKMSAQTKVEVTRGVFDPRTYKQVDKQNWARKRKPEWMATTGQIHFVRERTVASQEREQEDSAPVPVKVELVAAKKQPVQWVGRKRSDITREGGFMGYFGRTV